jgi:signal transduction histidine kinase
MTMPASVPASGPGSPPAPVLARPKLRALPLAGARLGAAACAFGAIGLRDPAWALLVLAAIAVAMESVRRLVAVARSGGATSVVLVAMTSALLLGTALLGSSLGGVTVGWLVAIISTGLICVGAGLQGWQAARRRTPWEQLTKSGAREVSLAATQAMTVIVGLLLLLLAAYISLGLLVRLRGTYPVLTVLFFAGVGFVLLVGAVVVVLVRAAVAQGAAGAAGAPVREQQAIAAHLHDSVLQTLALIGRQADDPAQVRQLARQQERSLRAWLAGRDEAQADSLAGAVRVAAQEVEDEHPGSRIEVVAVGDAPLDRSADAMVRAAREAMRNAVRHAGSPVRVFVEVDGAVREVFVRDNGTGFDLSAVSEERRGVRDAIIGRMEHVGGTAAIDSGQGGTEVALRFEQPERSQG